MSEGGTKVSSPRQEGAPWRARLLYTASALAVIGQHAPLIGYKTYANVDEAYAMALASRLMDGHVLYVGAVSQRGPLMYYTYEALARLVGWDNVVGLRVVALLWVLLSLAVLVWAARATLKRASPLVALALTAYAFAWGIPPLDGIALHGETLQVPLLLVGYVMGARAMSTRAHRTRLVLLCAAGVTLGAAICIKQTVLVHVAPLVVWLVVRGRSDLSRTAKAVLAYLGSVAFLPLVFVLHAWQNGSLQSFLFYTWTYNTRVHVGGERTSNAWLSPLMRELIFDRGFALALLFVCVVGGIWVVRRFRAGGIRALFRGFGVRQYLALHLAFALASASVLQRFFPHYFLPATAFLSLMVAVCVAALLPRALAKGLRTPMTLLAAIYLFYCGVVAAYGNEKIDGRVEEARTVKQVAGYVRAATTPEERVFVWGFSPWIYGYAGRKPAGRFLFETYVTGFVPWTWGDLAIERQRVVPGSMEQLMGDLEREDPKVVVDAGQVMFARSMRAYDAPARFLHERYCFALRISAYDVYLRKQGGSCPSPEYPALHRTLDYNDIDLDADAPPALDAQDAPPLEGDRHKPLFFGAPPPFCEAARDMWFERQRSLPEPDPCVVVGQRP